MAKKESNLKVVPKENPIAAEIKDQAAMAFIEGLLPQLTPFIEPAMEKLENYFGDNEKVFLMRRSVGKKPMVVILSNVAEGGYVVSNLTYMPYIPNKDETAEQEIDRLIEEVKERYKNELDIIVEAIKNKNNIPITKISNFKAFSQESVVNTFDSGQFVEKLMTGEFSK